MIIGRISCAGIYSNRFNQQNLISKASKNNSNFTMKQNVAFRGDDDYEDSMYDSQRPYGGRTPYYTGQSQPDQSQFHNYRTLYGNGYGRNEYSQEAFERDWARNHSQVKSYDENEVGYRTNHTLYAKEYISKGEYLNAIKEELKVAQSCKNNGEPENAFLVEESIRGLYTKLNQTDRIKAKAEIAKYNSDMAKYIEKDINCDPNKYYNM